MPYISQTRRNELDHHINELCGVLAESFDPEDISSGDFNYAITKIIHHFILVKGLRYENLNSAVGILECAKQEFIRTVVSPYEDKKIAENGCVSSLDNKEK